MSDSLTDNTDSTEDPVVQWRNTPSTDRHVQFIQSLLNLLDGFEEVFPECNKVKSSQHKIRRFVFGSESEYSAARAAIVVQEWSLHMPVLVEACATRSLDRIWHQPIRFINDLDLRTKWQDASFDAESREAFFTYLDQLNRLASTVDQGALPSLVTEQVQQVTAETAQRILAGDTSFSNADIMSFTQNALAQMTAADKAQMIQMVNDMHGVNLQEMMAAAGISDISEIINLTDELIKQSPS